MKMIESLRSGVEKQAFGVCTWLGDKFKMPTSVVRLFFIYTSFITLGSPLIIYMTLAFWLGMKKYIRNRRTSVWDL